MKFVKVLIIEWYDNVIKAFCTTSDDTIYYCTLLSLKPQADEKLYLCVKLEYLEGYNKLIEIIKLDLIKESWDVLPSLIIIKSINKTFLIKTHDIVKQQIELIKYQDNYKWPNNILYGEYSLFLNASEDLKNLWLIEPL